jgi:hypothetical protein
MRFLCQVGLVVAQVVAEEWPDERSQLSDHLAVIFAAHFPLWSYTHPYLLRESSAVWVKSVEITHTV